ncbi:MAG: hypothetical protein CMJ75_18685 [Planctomycetaceae bacterium]|nr:hypothetical protein [Planctomycetaceae bacterium]
MRPLSVRGTFHFARCWKISEGELSSPKYFTDHDVPLVFDNATWIPNDGLGASAIATGLNQDAGSVELRGVISSSEITEADLRAGVYNNALVEEFLVDARFPWAGKYRTNRYRMGQISWNEKKKTFEADSQSVVDQLRKNVGGRYSRRCRWTLGDNDCGVNLVSFQSGLMGILTIVDDFTITTTAPPSNDVTGYYDDGSMVVGTGDLAGKSFPIKSYDSDTNTFKFQIPVVGWAVSDVLVAQAGCNHRSGVAIDGTADTEGHCKNKFSNLANFGGFPFLPTDDKLFSTPDSKS